MITWIIGLLMIIILISLGLTIAFSMMTVGFIGLSFIIGIEPALSMVGQVFFDNGMSYTLSILPLFLFFRSITQANFSASIPLESCIVPFESDIDTTLPSSWITFSAAN